MGLLELIKNIGENNVTVQCVNNCFTSAKYKKRTFDTEVTIITTEISVDDLHDNTGIVLNAGIRIDF